MAYLRFEPQRGRILRLRISLVDSHKVNRATVQERVGNLGSVIVAEIGSAPERARFWGQLAGRFAKIEAKFPGRVSSKDRAKFEAAIALRIERPVKAAAREFFQALSERRAPLPVVKRQKGSSPRVPA